MDITMNTSLVVDGNNLLAMNTHAHLGLSSPKDGTPTGGMYGVVRKLHAMLLGELDRPPSSVLFVMDDRHPKFRRKLVPTYKTGRAEARAKTKDGDDFYKAYKYQLGVIDRLLLPLGVHVVKASGYEADDCLAGLALYGGYDKVVIVSGDKDLLQLIGKRVRVYKPSQHQYAAHPGKGYLLRRCFEGDASDNIPGVGGIGEKKSAAIVGWLSEEGFLLTPEGFMEAFRTRGDMPHLAQLKKIEDVRLARLFANWRVMNLRRTARKAFKKTVTVEGRYNEDLFRKECRRLGFRSLLEDLGVFLRPFSALHGELHGR